jgi:S-adenosylmethionine synthetase
MLFADIAQGVNNAFEQVSKATSAISSGTFTVSKENVLAAGRIIESQASALNTRVRRAGRDIRIDPPGGDDVSIRIAPAWNDRLVEDDDSYVKRVEQYVASLRKLAVQLGDTAKAYGYTEDQIEAAFRGKGV